MTEENLSEEEFNELIRKAAWHWKKYYEKFGIDSESAKEMAINKIKVIVNNLKMTKMVGSKVLPKQKTE